MGLNTPHEERKSKETQERSQGGLGLRMEDRAPHSEKKTSRCALRGAPLISVVAITSPMKAKAAPSKELNAFGALARSAARWPGRVALDWRVLAEGGDGADWAGFGVGFFSSVFATLRRAAVRGAGGGLERGLERGRAGGRWGWGGAAGLVEKRNDWRPTHRPHPA
eukprot:scaffold2000_cov86-Isochrysis_galbana.AAC.1